MLRVLQHSRVDIAAPEGFAATSVDVTRDDGTAVDTGATVTGGVYTLDPADTATLDVLTFMWADADGQLRRSLVEVVGGYTFDVAEARKHAPIKDFPDLYPDDRIELARTAAEVAMEDAMGVALVPRAGHAKVDGNGTDELLIPWPEPRAVLSVAIDGTELTADELADIEPLDYGALYRPSDTATASVPVELWPWSYSRGSWPRGRRNIEVSVEHGFEYPPGRVPQAALSLALYLLTDGPLSDRTISATNQDGTFQSYVVAGVRGAIFALPEVNAVAEQYGMKGGAW